MNIIINTVLQRLCLFVFGMMLLPVSSLATSIDSLSAFTRFGKVGASFAISDISDGKPSLLVYSGYTHTLTSALSFEAQVEISQRSYAYSELSNNLDFITTIPRFIPQHTAYSRIGQSIITSVGATFVPFDNDRYYFGIGLLMRWSGMMRSKIITRLDSLSQMVELIDTRQTALGAYLSAEYIFPINSRIDLGLQLKSQFFLPPFVTIGHPEPIGSIFPYFVQPSFYGNTIALGAFFRVNF